MSTPRAEWADVDISDISFDEPASPAVDPAPDLAPMEVAAPLAEEGGATETPDTPDTAPPEDQRAWWMERMPDNPVDAHLLVKDMLERDVNFKRAVNNHAAAINRTGEHTRRMTDLQAENENLKRSQARLMDKVGADFLQSMTPDQFKQYMETPTGQQMWSTLQEQRQLLAAPLPQQVPAHVQNVVDQLDDMAEQAALHLPENEYLSLRAAMLDPKEIAAFGDNPVGLWTKWSGRVDARIQALHSERVRNAGMPPAAAPARRADPPAATPLVQGNENIARLAPDRAPRNGNGQYSRTYTGAEIADMAGKPEYDELLKAHDAKNSRDLIRAGVIVG